MMCFVEYRSAGFWCKSEMLRDWIAEAIAMAKGITDPPQFLTTAMTYWDAIRSAARYGRADLRFDVSITNPVDQHEFEQFLALLAQRTYELEIHSISLMALNLIRGELDGKPAEILD